MFVIFFFNQIQDKVSFSTACLANEYACVRFFDIACHFLFDAGFVRELIKNEKCLKIILKGISHHAPRVYPM